MDVPVRPHLFLFSTKATAAVDFVTGAEGGTENHKLPGDTKQFFQSLAEKRIALVAALSTSGGNLSTVEDVDSALAAYLSWLNHLLLPPPHMKAEQASNGLRGLWKFSWDSFLGGGGVAANDVHYEVVSVLVNVALWKAKKAWECIQVEDISMADAPQVSQSYNLLKQSAGLVAHAIKAAEGMEHNVPGDCSKSGLNGLMKALLAEAQTLTTLRAVAKKNTPAIIAGLAQDVHMLYRDSLSDLRNANAKSMKLLHYLEYKSLYFLAYSTIFHSSARLAEMEGGEAVRLAQEAQKECENATRLGQSYDGCQPTTKLADREVFHEGLVVMVNSVASSAENDNAKVYLRVVPTELPQMPEPRRLVEATAFDFPSPDSSVDRSHALKADWVGAMMAPGPSVVVDIKEDLLEHEKHGSGNQKDKKEDGSSWWRWLIVILTVPLLIAITLLGVIVWIILLPVKIFCCPFGCAAQLLWNVAEWIVKAPLRAALWASGKPWRPEEKKENKK